MCVTSSQTVETGFPMNLHSATSINSMLTPWYVLVPCYLMSNDNSSLMAKEKAVFTSLINKTPGRDDGVCLVNLPGRWAPAGGLGEHWGLTKPGRCGCSNRCALPSMISDHLLWKHVFKNTFTPSSPLGWLFFIVSCLSKMLTTLAVTSWGLFYAHDNLRHLNCIASPWKEDTQSSAMALPGTINKGNPGMNA